MTDLESPQTVSANKAKPLGCGAFLLGLAGCIAVLWLTGHMFGFSASVFTGLVLVCAGLAYWRELGEQVEFWNQNSFKLRWFLRTTFYLFTLGIVVGSTLILGFLSSAPPIFPAQPPFDSDKLRFPLTANLPNTYAEIPKEFDARVKARYKLGMPYVDMAKDLQNQGFTRMDWSISPDDEHYARLDEFAFVCRNVLTIYWRFDRAEHITSIRGEFDPICL